MKSRIIIVTISVSGALCLGLIAFMASGVQQGRANAQRANLTAQEGTEARTPAYADSSPLTRVPTNAQPANAAPAFFESNATTTGAQPQSAPATVWQSEPNSRQPHHGLSGSSSQPIVIAIENGPQLSGDTVNLGAFQLKTIFGTVSIPVNTITGLRMGGEARQPATVCLSNGDSLTGELITESVTIKTAWGGATIGRDHITSIVTTTEPVTWQQQEGRWKAVLAAPKIDAGDEVDTFEPIDEAEPANQRPSIESGFAPLTTPADPAPLADDPGNASEN